VVRFFETLYDFIVFITVNGVQVCYTMFQQQMYISVMLVPHISKFSLLPVQCWRSGICIDCKKTI